MYEYQYGYALHQEQSEGDTLFYTKSGVYVLAGTVLYTKGRVSMVQVCGEGKKAKQEVKSFSPTRMGSEIQATVSVRGFSK